MRFSTLLRDRIKWLLFPGLNLHARLRNRILPCTFGSVGHGNRPVVLDAGCGNGMLSYQSYLRGNQVLGISIKSGEVERNRRLFHDMLGVPEDRLRFAVHNLYDLEALGIQFDEIICAEVLEHVADDGRVCRSFWNVLAPGGVLHLCCPNADHPDNQATLLDEYEAGGHVRAGYNLESYRALLDPLGFRIEVVNGLGGPVTQWCNRRITWAQQAGGITFGIPAFFILWPIARLDRDNPKVPYSVYLRARKPKD